MDGDRIVMMTVSGAERCGNWDELGLNNESSAFFCNLNRECVAEQMRPSPHPGLLLLATC